MADYLKFLLTPINKGQGLLASNHHFSDPCLRDLSVLNPASLQRQDSHSISKYQEPVQHQLFSVRVLSCAPGWGAYRFRDGVVEKVPSYGARRLEEAGGRRGMGKVRGRNKLRRGMGNVRRGWKKLERGWGGEERGGSDCATPLSRPTPLPSPLRRVLPAL